MTMIPTPKDLIQLYLDEVWTQRNFDLARSKYWSDAFVARYIVQVPAGEPTVVDQIERFLHAFPDAHLRMTDCIEESNRAVARIRITGTHQGTFMGVPATGKNIDVEEIAWVTLSNGKIDDIDPIVDLFSLFQQLGQFPGVR